MDIFKENIKRRILEENKKAWSLLDVGGDWGRFETEILVPLLDFEDEGCLDLKLHRGGGRSESRIDRVDILGDPKFDDE